jgi:hypothetical protein
MADVFWKVKTDSGVEVVPATLIIGEAAWAVNGFACFNWLNNRI